jgi:predicted dehydrogenase
LEIYGEKGSLLVPDPNFFGGTIEFASASQDWKIMPTQHAYADDNYRIIGVADMAQAIREDRPHRASGALGYHVLEVMLAFEASSRAGAAAAIQSRPERPAVLPTPSIVGPLD